MGWQRDQSDKIQAAIGVWVEWSPGSSRLPFLRVANGVRHPPTATRGPWSTRGSSAGPDHGMPLGSRDRKAHHQDTCDGSMPAIGLSSQQDLRG